MLELEPTARFQDSINGGDVVVELKPGQTLRHHYFEYNDEGWNRTIIEWQYHGQTVTRTHFNEGRDCDGYLSSHFVQLCPVNGLRSATVNRPTGERWEAFTDHDGTTAHECVTTWEEQPGWPAWTDDSHEYYDANAVAAGY